MQYVKSKEVQGFGLGKKKKKVGNYRNKTYQ